MQAPPALGPVIPVVTAYGGVLALIFFAGYWAIRLYRMVTEARDKKPVSDTPDLRGVLTGALDGFAQHTDLELTQHFDQLRRDLTTTIERAHERTQKQNVDAMQRFLLELELFVKTPTERRRSSR